jgi:general secretion pathway protein C
VNSLHAKFEMRTLVVFVALVSSSVGFISVVHRPNRVSGAVFWDARVNQVRVARVFQSLRGLSRTLAGLLALLLLVLLAWRLGAWLSGGLSPLPLPDMPALQAVNQSADHPEKPALALFGQPSSSALAQAVAEPSESVSDTRLKLTLLGVIDLPPHSVAIIQQGQAIEVVALGETISQGVSLYRVAASEVILLNRGRLERLVMAQGLQGLLSEKSAPAASDVAVLRELRQSLLQNPMRISELIHFEPKYEQGQLRGIAIQPRQHPQLFRRLGFQSGDVIAQINGQSLQDLAKQPANWAKLMQQTRFELVLERNGLSETLSLDLNQLTE